MNSDLESLLFLELTAWQPSGERCPSAEDLAAWLDGEGADPELVHGAGRDGRRGGWEGVPAGARRVDVFLPRRSLQVQSGPCRFNFAHSIRNENLRAPRRVSITFRRSQMPRTRTRVRVE